MPSRSRGTPQAPVFFPLRLATPSARCNHATAAFFVQVREAVGVMLSVLCSNMRLFATSGLDHLSEGTVGDAYMFEPPQKKNWAK
ncbi:hypothetical protein ACMD2_03375, partial [Ananas comosus]